MLLPVSYPTKREWEHVRSVESDSASAAKLEALRLRHEREKAVLSAQHQERFAQFEDDRYYMFDERTMSKAAYEAHVAKEAIALRKEMVNQYEDLSVHQISENLGPWKAMERQGLGGSSKSRDEDTTKANTVLKSAMRK